jgi:hypothetical protein
MQKIGPIAQLVRASDSPDSYRGRRSPEIKRIKFGFPICIGTQFVKTSDFLEFSRKEIYEDNKYIGPIAQLVRASDS